MKYPPLPIKILVKFGKKTKSFKVPITKIGRFHYEYKSSNHGSKLWNRTRWWPTRRTILWTQGVYNRKSLKAEKIRKGY